MILRQLDINTDNFGSELRQLLAWESISDGTINSVVNDILDDVKNRGDQALVDYTNQFDNRSVERISELTVHTDQLANALNEITEKLKDLRSLEINTSKLRPRK